MKNNASLVYNFFLVVGDFLAALVAFIVAYVLRVSLSHRALSQQITFLNYVETLLLIVPFFILIFALLGLYTNRFFEKRFNEIGRLLIGTLTGVMFAISYGYLANVAIFPARLVVFYSFGLVLFFIILFRTAARGLRRRFFRLGRGINNVVIVGENTLTHTLLASLANTAVTGYKVLALVSNSSSRSGSYARYKTFLGAMENVGANVHTIIQTELYADGARNDEILTYAQENHVAYRFVPGNSELFTGNLDAEVFHSVPVIAVHQTPLIGWGRVVKRAFDIITALFGLIITSPVLLIVAILVRITDNGPVFFKHKRLSRFGEPVYIYKFRTHKMAYNGLEPEEAFTKMGKPELIKQYRDNGDQLAKDPRVTTVGRFIRRYSLDELPQLWNVLRGDISLVGPRATVAYELEKYSRKNLILSVKSGLTGLAQVSGRSDIGFEERRALDLYYVQNWTFWGDVVILIKTVWIIVKHKGAR